MRSRMLEMVNSPSTTATVRNVADTSEVRRLGMSTRRNVVPHPAPRLRDASTNVRRSMLRRPASMERYVNGRVSTT